MEELSPFASRDYFIALALLLFARGTDILSTHIATPTLALEGNPLVKKMGWKWMIPLNLLMCAGFAFMPFPAIIIATTSVLVAARNFQQAWLMQSMGEEPYRAWHVARIRETPPTLYLGCLCAQTALIALVGTAVCWFSAGQSVLIGIGVGIIGYATAVVYFTLLSVWRLRRKMSEMI